MTRLQKQEQLTTSGDRIGVCLRCYERSRKRQEGSKEMELHSGSEEPAGGAWESQLEVSTFIARRRSLWSTQYINFQARTAPVYLDIYITDHAVTVRSRSKLQDERLGERAEGRT